MKRTCNCGQGHMSAYDGKCGHCRSSAERKRHSFRLHRGLYVPKGKAIQYGQVEMKHSEE